MDKLKSVCCWQVREILLNFPLNSNVKFIEFINLGLHAVADIFCEKCRTPLGWKYEHAFESSQKYKEGKYIIELAHMIKENKWDWSVNWIAGRLLEITSKQFYLANTMCLLLLLLLLLLVDVVVKITIIFKVNLKMLISP